jgi:beta-lactam-binding protein with PASTA domain
LTLLIQTARIGEEGNALGRRRYVRRAAAIVAFVVVAVIVSASVSAGASAARTASKVVVPDVVGLRMDRATRTLHARGLRVNEECSGIFGCIIKSRWWICEQDPSPGTRVRKYSVVVIYGERRGEC